MKKTVMLTVPLLVLAYYGTTQVTTAQGVCERQAVKDGGLDDCIVLTHEAGGPSGRDERV